MKVVTQNMTWAEAKRHCEGDGAKLVSLKDEWKQAYVELMALNLQAPLWIGLNKMEVTELSASQTTHSKLTWLHTTLLQINTKKIYKKNHSN